MTTFIDSTSQNIITQVQLFCNEHIVNLIDEENGSKDDAIALHQKMAGAGFLKLGFPKALGGAEVRVVDIVAATETFAQYSNLAVNLFLVNTVFAGITLLFATNQKQKQEFIPPLMNGSLRFAFAVTEADAGSDVYNIKTHARAEGDTFVINGSKIYTTGAEIADYIITAVRTGDHRKQLSLFLIPTNAKGVTLQALDKISGNAFASCSVNFSNVVIPKNYLLGEEQGWHQGVSHLAITGQMERLSVAASCLGATQTAFEAAQKHAALRQQFGQPIGKFQVIQHKLVDMATELEAMRLLVYHAAHKLDLRQPAIKEVCMAKAYCTEKAYQIVIEAMKILGGRSYFKPNPVERILRESLLGLFAGGTNEIQKNHIAKILNIS